TFAWGSRNGLRAMRPLLFALRESSSIHRQVAVRHTRHAVEESPRDKSVRRIANRDSHWLADSDGIGVTAGVVADGLPRSASSNGIVVLDGNDAAGEDQAGCGSHLGYLGLNTQRVGRRVPYRVTCGHPSRGFGGNVDQLASVVEKPVELQRPEENGRIEWQN